MTDEKNLDEEDKPVSPAVERWLDEFKKLSPEEQREVRDRFFAEFFPRTLAEIAVLASRPARS